MLVSVVLVALPGIGGDLDTSRSPTGSAGGGIAIGPTLSGLRDRGPGPVRLQETGASP
ncbi:hypothetical protein ACFFV7_03865 [Nonomuraea spiralis]|uniref:Uncharacterized protein n=1 Tax=Nonomuraea spiralis TaxID=46182 RepID=A0ABV5I8E7_9ACTN|nr:hypothetical protein [Nonomuraea spiralis]